MRPALLHRLGGAKPKHPNLSWAACQMVEDMPVCYCRRVAFWTTQHWI